MPSLRPQSLAALTQTHGDRYRWILLSVVCLGIIAGVVETSSFNVAVPALSHRFGIGQETAQWTMTGFMAAMTVSMLPASWLLRRVGFRRVFLGAVTVLGLSSVAGSVADSFSLVVAARVLQGAATGVLQPLGLLVIVRFFPVEVQGRASGIMTLGLAAVPAVAPAFGGVLVDHFGWQSIFLLSVPFCGVALIAGALLLPMPSRLEQQPFDWLGSLLLSLATLMLMAAVTGLQDEGVSLPSVLGEFAVVAVFVAAFAAHASRHHAPLISLSLFRDRAFAMGALVSFTYGFGLFGSTYLIPVFLQDVLAYSATAAGSALVPGGIALLVTTPLAGRLADVYPPRSITTVGLLLLGGSFFVFAALGHHIGYGQLLAVTIVGRIGLGLILPALNLASMRQLQPHELPQSTVVVSYMRQLGGVLGIAATAVFVAWRQQALASSPQGHAVAYAQGFVLLGGLLMAAVLAALQMKPRAA